MEKRENQRVMLSRRLIKESLVRLLAQESIHRISIRALCEEAGINRSTFYKYYGSQYDVLTEMEEEMIGSVRDTLEDGLMDAASSRKKMEAICAYFEEHMASVRVLVGSNADPEFPERLFSLPQIKQIIIGRLKDSYAPEDLSYVYTFLVSGCYRLIQEWVARENQKPFTEVAMLLCELIDKICGGLEPPAEQGEKE